MDLTDKKQIYLCTSCGFRYKTAEEAINCCASTKYVSKTVYNCPICNMSYYTISEAYECRIRCTDTLLDEAVQWIARSCPLTKNCASNISCFANTCQHMDKERALEMVKACVERSKNHD